MSVYDQTVITTRPQTVARSESNLTNSLRCGSTCVAWTKTCSLAFEVELDAFRVLSNSDCKTRATLKIGNGFPGHTFVQDRLFHSPELRKGSAAFLQHGQSKGAHVCILSWSGSHELTAGFLLSVSAPHHPTQEYVIAVHVHLQLHRDRARMLPKSGCHDCCGKGRGIVGPLHISAK